MAFVAALAPPQQESNSGVAMSSLMLPNRYTLLAFDASVIIHANSMSNLKRYGLAFANETSPIEIERHMIRKGGQWIGKNGATIGNGLFWHYKNLMTLLWPDDLKWHKWNELQLEQYINNRAIGVMGPASSGKTNTAGVTMLTDYYVWPECSTVLICSTTRERLEDRIWGEIKKYHKLAKRRWPELPGNLIEGKQRIVTDSRLDGIDGRDFRNGIIGVPCKKGGDYVGLGDFIGIKNKRVRLAADELQLLPSVFVFSVSNLDKNPDFKVMGLGNPKDTVDALGTLCEPTPELGGWDGGIDQAPETKVWPTRFGGVALQLVGSDSPNLDGKLGIPLITQEAIDRDIERYGKDSLQFTMMNQGMMPRGQGSRRVITRQLCIKNKALDDPEWLDGNRVKIAFLDAAYRGVGGDRCIYGELEIGTEAATIKSDDFTPNLSSQGHLLTKHRQIIALTKTMLVPVNVKIDVEPEEQIVAFVKTQMDTSGIPADKLYFDSGMRTTLVTAFGRLWSPMVNSIDCGGNPSERMVAADIQTKCSDYYSKFITELWFSVRLAIESQQFRGMTESVMQEGCQREWTRSGKNKIEIETKEKMKEKTGRSPDLFDALAIGVEGARRNGFIIKNENSAVRSDRSNVTPWKTKLTQKARESWKEGALDYST